MEKINGVLLNGRVYTKKDNVSKGLTLNVLVNAEDLSSARVINLFAGRSYVGEYSLDTFKPLDNIVVEYEQEIGSQYPKLVNFTKAVKK